MSVRAPFQILVIPYIKEQSDGFIYAVFRRAGDSETYWQFIAGGGEDRETPLEAAVREAKEEACLNEDSIYYTLESSATIPVPKVSGFAWGPNVLVIPEIVFAAEVSSLKLTLSKEHSTYRWLPYEQAYALLQWDSNRNALWELNHRLTHGILESRRVRN